MSVHLLPLSVAPDDSLGKLDDSVDGQAEEQPEVAPDAGQEVVAGVEVVVGVGLEVGPKLKRGKNMDIC